MTKLPLSAALRRRNNRKNLKRYIHTRSFNRLAGNFTMSGESEHASLRTLSRREARFLFCFVFLGLGTIGIYYVLF